MPSLSISMEVPAGIHFVKQPGVFLAEIHFPKVVTAFKGGKVIKGLTVFGDDDAAHVRGIRGEAYHAVFHVFQFYGDVLYLSLVIVRGFFLSCIFLAAFLTFGSVLALRFFLFGFQLLAQFVVFLVQAVFVVGVLIEEKRAWHRPANPMRHEHACRNAPS